MNARTLITKGEYAKHRRVSAAAVSQYITAGYLEGALFLRDGTAAERKDRSALVDRDAADQQLRQRLHLGQMVGQGRLPPPRPADGDAVQTVAAAAPSPLIRPPSPEDEAANELVALRLEKARRDDERDRRKMAEEVGQYTPTAAIRSECTRGFSALLGAIESWHPELANAIASAVGVSRRDVQLVINAQWRAFRADRAKEARERRDTFAPFVSDLEEAPAIQE